MPIGLTRKHVNFANAIMGVKSQNYFKEDKLMDLKKVITGLNIVGAVGAVASLVTTVVTAIKPTAMPLPPDVNAKITEEVKKAVAKKK